MAFRKICLIKFSTFSKFTLFYGNLAFWNWVSLHARLNSHYETYSYEKKKKNMNIIQESCIERTQRKKLSINSRLKDI